VRHAIWAALLTSSLAVGATAVNGAQEFQVVVHPSVKGTWISRTSLQAVFTGKTDRWGDFTTTVVDPSDPLVFWTFQEYALSSGEWATQITQIVVPEPSSIALAAVALAALALAAHGRRRRQLARVG